MQDLFIYYMRKETLPLLATLLLKPAFAEDKSKPTVSDVGPLTAVPTAPVVAPQDQAVIQLSKQLAACLYKTAGPQIEESSTGETLVSTGSQLYDGKNPKAQMYAVIVTELYPGDPERSQRGTIWLAQCKEDSPPPSEARCPVQRDTEFDFTIHTLPTQSTFIPWSEAKKSALQADLEKALEYCQQTPVK